MLKTGVQPVVRVLLDRHGQLYSEAIGIDMRQGIPGWWLLSFASNSADMRRRSCRRQQSSEATRRPAMAVWPRTSSPTWHLAPRLARRVP